MTISGWALAHHYTRYHRECINVRRAPLRAFLNIAWLMHSYSLRH